MIKYKHISTIHEQTGERIILVRGKISKKHNPKGVWLRLTCEKRTRQARARRRKRPKHYREYAAMLSKLEKYKEKCKNWEQINEKRRKSPRRKLFNKLRKIGIPMDEARKQAQWY